MSDDRKCPECGKKMEHWSFRNEYFCRSCLRTYGKYPDSERLRLLTVLERVKNPSGVSSPIHDQFVMAALTGFLANENYDPCIPWDVTISKAHGFADDVMKWRAENGYESRG